MGLLAVISTLLSCKNEAQPTTPPTMKKESPFKKKVATYAKFKLSTDASKLSKNEVILIEKLKMVAEKMDAIFWKEAYGNKENILNQSDKYANKYIEYNYGPWDRLDGNKPFIDGVGEKPLGAQFYPKDMTKDEFKNAALKYASEQLHLVVS